MLQFPTTFLIISFQIPSLKTLPYQQKYQFIARTSIISKSQTLVQSIFPIAESVVVILNPCRCFPSRRGCAWFWRWTTGWPRPAASSCPGRSASRRPTAGGPRQSRQSRRGTCKAEIKSPMWHFTRNVHVLSLSSPKARSSFSTGIQHRYVNNTTGRSLKN